VKASWAGEIVFGLVAIDVIAFSPAACCRLASNCRYVTLFHRWQAEADLSISRTEASSASPPKGRRERPPSAGVPGIVQTESFE